MEVPNEQHVDLLEATRNLKYALEQSPLPKEEQVPYSGRNKGSTQNVICACSFDMMFTYVMHVWKGIMNDMSIFLECLLSQLKQTLKNLNFKRKKLLMDVCFCAVGQKGLKKV
ncbi:hypothetical protein M5K25_012675 [Dendrobium thyrsiflorum]|uniref:Uncharacterized protein n=1 Tax=Dendrobium thyrsiflorum TaxID=117978 RepID=A0ABD0V4K9_DENTH